MTGERAGHGLSDRAACASPLALPCPSCGYDLRGVDAASGTAAERCPECGLTLGASEWRRAQRPPLGRVLAFAQVGAAVLPIYAAVGLAFELGRRATAARSGVRIGLWALLLVGGVALVARWHGHGARMRRWPMSRRLIAAAAVWVVLALAVRLLPVP